jgi:aminodeoxyfutalosine deaminase
LAAYGPETECRLVEGLVDATRHGQTADWRNSLEAGGNVEGIAMVVARGDADHTLIHAHAESHTPRGGHICVADFGSCTGDRSTEAGHHIGEDGHEAVSDEVVECPPVFGHELLDQAVVVGHGRGSRLKASANLRPIGHIRADPYRPTYDRSDLMSLDPSLTAFVAAAPKTELHLHLVGSASASAVAALAGRHGSSSVPSDEESVRRYLRFVDFAHFIEVYAAVTSLVTTAQDIVDIIHHASTDLNAQNVRYAEMTVTPYSHVMSGVPYGEVVEALAEGRHLARVRGVELAWVFDVPGENGVAAAETTIGYVLEQPPDGLVGFGLGGLEAGVDRGSFAEVFDHARALGLRSVPHAGEADGPRSVWAALRHLHADRIGHGVRSVEDPRLVDHLVEQRIPLEICPSSNVCTNVYPSIAEHPVKQLIDAGVVVTLNTDDPAMFSTTLNGEYQLVADTFDLCIDDIAELIRNSIRASFLPDTTGLLTELDQVLAAHRVE